MWKSERENSESEHIYFTIVAVNELRISLIWVLLRWIMPGIRYIFFSDSVYWLNFYCFASRLKSFTLVKKLYRCRGKRYLHMLSIYKKICHHRLPDFDRDTSFCLNYWVLVHVIKFKTDVSNMHPSVANYWNGKGEGQVSILILFYFICYFLVSSLLLMPPLNSYQCAISVQRKVVLNSFSHKNYQHMWVFISYAIYLAAFEHLLRLNVWQRTFEKKKLREKNQK